MTDKLFVSAPFVSVLADMPPRSASIGARTAWLSKTRRTLLTAVTSGHGVEALRLATVINRELRELVGGLS